MYSMSADCDVCLNGNDGYAEFFTRTERRARKVYKCAECTMVILVGSQYVRVGGKYEGDLWSMRLCTFCDEINTVFSCGRGTEYGNLWEQMYDYVFPNLKVTSPCFHKLSSDARRFLIERWWKWKEWQL